MSAAVRVPLEPPRAARWAVLTLPLAFLAVVFLWPTIALLWRGFTGASGEDVLTAARTWRAFGTTLGLAAGGTTLSLALGLPAAWALFRVRWRGQAFVRALVGAPFALPTIVVATAFTALLRPSGLLGFLGADQSIAAIVAALAFFNVSVVTRVVGGVWSGLDPATLAAARTLGASPRRAFVHVTLPALRASIAAAAAIVFLFCASSFAIVLVLGGTRVSTVETEIWLQVNQFLDLRAAATLAILQVGIVSLALAASGWVRARRDRALGGRTADGSRRAGRRDVPGLVAALFPVAVLLGLPIAGLVERSLRTRNGWGLDHYSALLAPPERAVLAVPVWRAVLTSLETATIAAAVAMAAGVTLAYAVARWRRTGWAGSLAMLPLGVSSVIVGLGVLLTLRRALPGGIDLGSSFILIPAAQAVVAFPLVVRSLVPALRGVAPGLRQSAATLGASPWATWRLVEWPLVRRPIAVAWGFAFAVSLGEFGATSFLARPDRPTLPTAIYRLLSRPGLDNVGTAFAATVLLAAITGTIMVAAERLRGRTGAEI
jgi:thiamine transport system permease protein